MNFVYNMTWLLFWLYRVIISVQQTLSIYVILFIIIVKKIFRYVINIILDITF